MHRLISQAQCEKSRYRTRRNTWVQRFRHLGTMSGLLYMVPSLK
ncbi:hypothetical protein CLOBOL_00224 [Enterocloster bolteae ATCC BAA-613]|uniref:Uncharacterized protein n=1 Tax=Enterocloster bolteae (strain ATCC BAA-613 / DSM 15670 / CCUG 46953 / JCM 12243 / WAL 16351) TaxID=411902 RepID=A8RGT9_ENTBW|nr:hypothetical protein CLOBOL_00224 [Enterocloster bolteae ATCC BAA-613]